jgi:hypothetical protein
MFSSNSEARKPFSLIENNGFEIVGIEGLQFRRWRDG